MIDVQDRRKRLHGLYVITDSTLALQAQQPIETMIAQALAGGARIIQYRNKNANNTVRFREARQLLQLCKSAAATFLVNDDVELAAEIDADGVHLGQQDMPLPAAREYLGSGKIIGITCHALIDHAEIAQQQGADYVAFGRFFASQTKPAAPAAGLDILTEAKQRLHIPVCAIGGITVQNAAQVIEHGADMLAVVNAVLAAPDIAHAANEFAQLFK